MKDHNGTSGQIKRPSFFLLLTEGGRALTELSLFFPFQAAYRTKAGDNHPVLVLPGFMASDVSTKLLRKFLKKSGYQAYRWGLGRNYGRTEYQDQLLAKIDQLYAQEQRRVSLVGWSLGGVYARQLAKLAPEKVRQVITLGSPFRGIDQPSNALWLYNLISDKNGIENLDPELLRNLPEPAPVPTTAIYTKSDGVVSWKVCLEKEENEIHQNIQVRGSHLGLGVNPIVLRIIVDRLQYTQENWVPFKPKNKLDDKVFYPSLSKE